MSLSGGHGRSSDGCWAAFLRREKLIDCLVNKGPERRESRANRVHATQHLFARGAIETPGAALRRQVLEKRLEAVDGVGEAGFGRLLRLEFFPEGTKPAAEIGREDAEEAVGGPALALGSRLGGFGIVSEGILGVDFHQVVRGQHFENMFEIERLDGIFAQHHGSKDDVPGVLGGVFAARAVGEQRAAEDEFQFIGFGEKCGLPGQSLILHGAILPESDAAGKDGRRSAWDGVRPLSGGIERR